MKSYKTDKIEELTCLYEIARTLNATLDLKKSLYNVLDILSGKMGMVRGTITILSPFRDEISIEVAHGLSRAAVMRGKYKPGEGITGQVIQTGKAKVVPKISEEPFFLNRTASRKDIIKDEISFFCVPVKNKQQVIGALSVDHPFDEAYSLKDGERFLTIIGAMIAQQVVNLERINLEKEHLMEENRRLKEELSEKYNITNIIGNGNKMREVFQMIFRVSQSNATVLIRGESGTGKELVANAIHYNSLRAERPFIKINCAAIPTNLIESDSLVMRRGLLPALSGKRRASLSLPIRGALSSWMR